MSEHREHLLPDPQRGHDCRGALTVGLHADMRQRFYRGQDRLVLCGPVGWAPRTLTGRVIWSSGRRTWRSVTPALLSCALRSAIALPSTSRRSERQRQRENLTATDP